MSTIVTIHRAHGFRFAILTDDNEPAHVHIYGSGEAKIEIRAADGKPQLIWSIGLKANDRRRAMEIVLERQTEFLAQWNAIHGEQK